MRWATTSTCPGWEGGLQVEGAPQCEKWRRKAGTNIARALQASALAPFRVKIRNRPGKAHAAKGRHPGWLLLLRLPRVRLSPVPPHIGQGPSETGKGARRSLAVLRPRTPPYSHCILESVRQPAKANCTMPQPTAYADALGHYLYLPIPTRTGRQRSGMTNETDSALAPAVKRVLCGTRSS